MTDNGQSSERLTDNFNVDTQRRIDILDIFDEAQNLAEGWTLTGGFDESDTFKSGYGVSLKRTSVKRSAIAKPTSSAPLARFARYKGARPNTPRRLDAHIVQWIHTLAAQGAGSGEIARTVGVNRKTVTAYLGKRDPSAGLRRHHARRKAEGRPILPPWYLKKLKNVMITRDECGV